MSRLLDEMKQNNYIYNTKGAKYYAETYNSNLDVFCMLSRYNPTDEIILMFNNALKENEDLALANLLYILDVRDGKGERLLFKTIYKNLCENHPKQALRILPFISKLGRYDYVLVGMDTPVENDTVELIKKQLEDDEESNNPSLLAKWLPSHRTHGENSKLAKKLRLKLGLTEQEYRKRLSALRSKINIIEKNLTEKNYDNVDFSKIPAKAMLKYNQAFENSMEIKFNDYKESVKKGEQKINTKGLLAYEIVKKILYGIPVDNELYDLMWENQKDIFEGNNSNVLVVADTSGSMEAYGYLPLATALGLALYTAERNHGVFKNHFITFSSHPILQEIKGSNITEKVRNFKMIIDCTDIDKVFELILSTATKSKLTQDDMPSHILIISDMEFDEGTYTKNGTNFQGWKDTFSDAGYKLPNIVFWNVAGYTRGVPATKMDNDVAMISGFSVNVLENVLDLDTYNPVKIMLNQLEHYLKMLGEAHE